MVSPPPPPPPGVPPPPAAGVGGGACGCTSVSNVDGGRGVARRASPAGPSRRSHQRDGARWARQPRRRARVRSRKASLARRQSSRSRSIAPSCRISRCRPIVDARAASSAADALAVAGVCAGRGGLRTRRSCDGSSGGSALASAPVPVGAATDDEAVLPVAAGRPSESAPSVRRVQSVCSTSPVGVHACIGRLANRVASRCSRGGAAARSSRCETARPTIEPMSEGTRLQRLATPRIASVRRTSMACATVGCGASWSTQCANSSPAHSDGRSAAAEAPAGPPPPPPPSMAWPSSSAAWEPVKALASAISAARRARRRRMVSVGKATTSLADARSGWRR